MAGSVGRGAKVLSRVPLTPTAVLVTVQLPDRSLVSLVVGGPVRVLFRDQAEAGDGSARGEEAAPGAESMGWGSPFYDRR